MTRLDSAFLQPQSKQVGFFKKNPIERSAATSAAADNANVN